MIGERKTKNSVRLYSASVLALCGAAAAAYNDQSAQSYTTCKDRRWLLGYRVDDGRSVKRTNNTAQRKKGRKKEKRALVRDHLQFHGALTCALYIFRLKWRREWLKPYEGPLEEAKKKGREKHRASARLIKNQLAETSLSSSVRNPSRRGADVKSSSLHATGRPHCCWLLFHNTPLLSSLQTN